jgi:esterase/lipase superfamily enzyme
LGLTLALGEISMNEDELKRQMDFIVEQQAKFSTDVIELRLAQTELTLKHSKLTDALIGVVGMVGTLSRSQEGLVDKVDSLADAQKATDEQLKATDERVNVLIDVVEKYFSDRRNGSDHNKSGS